MLLGFALALFGLGALGLLTQVRSQSPASTRGPVRGLDDTLVVNTSSLWSTIAGLQARLEAIPTDWQSYASLGLAYVQQARVTADPSYYPRAEAALRRSLSMHARDNYPAFMGLGALALARHDFAGGLSWGRRARAINPYNGNIRGVIGDSLIELGRYREAFGELQSMVDLKPDLASYARVSYARELQGDQAGAISAMKLSMESAGSLQDQAWASNQVGDLYFNSGDLSRAERAYRRARAADPGFIAPIAGLGRVAAAKGRIEEAIAAFRRVVTRYPLPEYVVFLGDLYARSDRGNLARRQYSLVRAQEALLRANGVNVDLEIALFNSDHGVRTAEGLAAARSEWARRKSVHVADALAWALYANGSYREALRYANQALRLGTRNALFHFHRGMIQRALHRPAPAREDLRRALDINPQFSILWSARAARILASLRGAA